MLGFDHGDALMDYAYALAARRTTVRQDAFLRENHDLISPWMYGIRDHVERAHARLRRGWGEAVLKAEQDIQIATTQMYGETSSRVVKGVEDGARNGEAIRSADDPPSAPPEPVASLVGEAEPPHQLRSRSE